MGHIVDLLDIVWSPDLTDDKENWAGWKLTGAGSSNDGLVWEHTLFAQHMLHGTDCMHWVTLPSPSSPLHRRFPMYMSKLAPGCVGQRRAPTAKPKRYE